MKRKNPLSVSLTLRSLSQTKLIDLFQLWKFANNGIANQKHAARIKSKLFSCYSFTKHKILTIININAIFLNILIVRELFFFSLIEDWTAPGVKIVQVCTANFALYKLQALKCRRFTAISGGSVLET